MEQGKRILFLILYSISCFYGLRFILTVDLNDIFPLSSLLLLGKFVVKQ
ncbi:unnamed protein product [Phytomonas sp. EM1]|nr:unnamed protein product [Phytomonas sp. EM1]|eukprot:CCW65824.1 unnamed protein product [Phytomonas sp. isolate EM1]